MRLLGGLRGGSADDRLNTVEQLHRVRIPVRRRDASTDVGRVVTHGSDRRMDRVDGLSRLGGEPTALITRACLPENRSTLRRRRHEIPCSATKVLAIEVHFGDLLWMRVDAGLAVGHYRIGLPGIPQFTSQRNVLLYPFVTDGAAGISSPYAAHSEGEYEPTMFQAIRPPDR
jgi:hypothetical protein